MDSDFNVIRNSRAQSAFYLQSVAAKEDVDRLVGDMNSGLYKFDHLQPVVVWHGFLRWFREMKPFPLLHSNNVAVQFVDAHSEMEDDDLVQHFVAMLVEPYFSLLLWSLDLIIELSGWSGEKLNADNQMIAAFVPALFGLNLTLQRLLPQQAHSFVVRLFDLRKQQRLS